MRGWFRTEFEGLGEVTVRQGDCIAYQGEIRQEHIEYSDDFEVHADREPGGLSHRQHRALNVEREMITLYDFGNSVCCQKVRITLCEKGLEWQAIQGRPVQQPAVRSRLPQAQSERRGPHAGPRRHADHRIDTDLRIPRRHVFPIRRSFPRTLLGAPACGCGARRSTRACSKAFPRSASPPCSASG